MSAANARQAALDGIVRCRRDGAWASAGMDAILARAELERRDAALASRLCLGVLENTSLLDFYIDAFTDTKLEPKLRDILRLGVYQLLFLDRVPARAAVNETVALCRANGCGRASGLVNAVLRRVADEREKLPEIPGEGTAEYLSVRYSHPRWLCQRLVERHGYPFAEAFLAANNAPAPLTIQVNTLRVRPEDYLRALARAGIAAEQDETLPGCLTLADAVVPQLPGFEEGLFYVQDRAARLAVEIAGPERGMRVLDACACPGGKSFAAAIRMDNQGEILACDIHEKKLGLVSSGAERLGIGCIQTRVRDAREADESLAGAFDLVIADVPCSGLGVIRKKPEIRGKSEEELRRLPEIQSTILAACARLVRPGGVLLYSTCTILEEENEQVVMNYVNQNDDLCLEAFAVGPLASPTGFYTFWPQTDGTDGFFAAKLRKKA